MPGFYFFKHQNKERALVDALIQAGWVETGAKEADVIFADNDYGIIRPQLEGYHRQGKIIFIYPHGGRVNLFNDFAGSEPLPFIRAQFVTAEGHKEILQRINYPHPVEVIGWYLCPLVPFTPRPQVRNVLFAPIHPDADGTLSDINKQVNYGAFEKLVHLFEKNEIYLTVRHLHTLKKNGLPPAVPGVTYIQGKPDQTYKEIDKADLIVTTQTFLYLSVARGVPTVGMGEGTPPHISGKIVQSFQKYKKLLAYPFDILDWTDTLGLFHMVNSAQVTTDWQRRMCGEAFDAGAFVEKVEKYL